MWEPITGNQFSVIYLYIVVDLSTCMPFFILHCVKTTVLNINIFHYTLSKLDQHCGKTMLKYSVYLSNALALVALWCSGLHVHVSRRHKSLGGCTKKCFQCGWGDPL